MTTPQTPKPLTEKEPLTDEEFRNAERDLDRAVNPDDCVVWTAAYGELLIAELKRLRAGQARETSSKSEMKILRDALERAKKDNIRVREFLRGPRKDNLIACLLDEYEAILWAIEQADAVKGIE